MDSGEDSRGPGPSHIPEKGEPKPRRRSVMIELQDKRNKIHVEQHPGAPQDLQLNAQQGAEGKRRWLDGSSLGAFIVGAIVMVPLTVALVILAVAVLPYFALVLILLVLAMLLVLGLGLVPLGIILKFSPPLHLFGYHPLACPKALSNKSSFKSTDILNYDAVESTDENNNIPMLIELRSLLRLSDYVYMLSGFRRLSILGKIPVEFKYISLECDEMNQWDIIKGEPHKEKAFGVNDGERRAGIRASVMVITVLRFLLAEAEKQRVKHISTILMMGARPRRNLMGDVKQRAAIIMEKRDGTRGGSIGGKKRDCLLGPSDDDEKKMYGGLSMFEDLFLRGVKDTAYSCDRHALGGTLCSHLGLHGVQCFIDALIREGSNGCNFSEEFFGVLQNDGIDDDEFDSKVGRINEILSSIAAKGKVFNDLMAYALMDMTKTDSRVVWTNDRAGDGECVYLICVSETKRRVNVIFRGTTTLTDIMKNTDFSPMIKPNPIKEDYPGKTSSIEMNNGYAGYLFEKRVDTKRTKFDEIADRAYEYGEELGEGGFSLYVSGHSMGGALATLFGFQASLDERFAQKNNPVRVFTFAGAIPGRITFAKAFQHQEHMGLIQHLRVTNDHDIVPLAHPEYITKALGIPEKEFDFAHTGISLCLHADKNKLPAVKYVKDIAWWQTLKANIQTNVFLNLSWSNTSSIGTNHSPYEHAGRIHKVIPTMVEHGLVEVTLNDLYDAYVH